MKRLLILMRSLPLPIKREEGPVDWIFSYYDKLDLIPKF